MDNKQREHLEHIIKEAVDLIKNKYEKGAEQHGGCLSDLPKSQLLMNSIDEALDQLTYLLTLKQEIAKTGFNFDNKIGSITVPADIMNADIYINKFLPTDKVFEGLGRLMNDHALLNDELLSKVSKVKSVDLLNDARSGKHGPLDQPSVWLRMYIRAMKDEVRELEESIEWKWWRNGNTDMENVRVELIDIFHFLLSACIASGMDGTDLVNIYYKKRKLNFDRQKNGFKKGDNEELGIGKL